MARTSKTEAGRTFAAYLRQPGNGAFGFVLKLFSTIEGPERAIRRVGLA